ncbi:hypothetical protein C8R47DRAFT_1088686 [Mycena vitilis]|nr:hypothetical protein C8R47DRAFT_1088686 [Mycena vitilis]
MPPAPRCNCYAALRTLFIFELGIRTDHHLVTSGLYTLVRHPSYRCMYAYTVHMGGGVYGARAAARASLGLRTCCGRDLVVIGTHGRRAYRGRLYREVLA